MKYFVALSLVCAFLLSTACTQSPEKLLAAADKYHRNKKYKEASILYQKVIAKDKTNAEAYYREGLNLIDDGQAGEATRFLRRAVDLKPTNTDAEAKLAQIYLIIYSQNPKKYVSLLSDARDLVLKILQQSPNSFDGLRLQGIIDYTDKNFDKALQRFQRANQIKPYSRDLIGWYAEVLTSAKREPEAIALVQDMLAHDKTWGPGYDFLFMQYTSQKNPAKAEAVLRERMQNEPNNPVATQNLANFLLATNRYDEAEGVMKRVLDMKNLNTGRLMLGDFYLHAKKFDKALQEYQTGASQDSKMAVRYTERIIAVDQVLGKRDEALRLARDLSDKNPKDASASEMYASLLLQTGASADAKKSLEELKKLVQNNPNNAMLHLDLSRAYFSQNDKDKSLNEALEAFREQPNLLPAHVIAARIYEDRGDHSKAIEQTDFVLQSQPNDPDARLIRDRALIGTNQMSVAQPDLEALVKQYPKATEAHLQLATLYLNQKEYTKAAGEFQQVWTAKPPDARGFLGLQLIKLAQGQGDDAVRSLQDLAQKNPNVSAYSYQLANFEATVGAEQARAKPEHAKQLFQQAVDNYQQVLKTNPKSTDVWVRLGLVQRQLDDRDGALKSFQEAEKVNPRDVGALGNEGMLLEDMGKKKEAMDIYNRMLGIDPNNTLALNNLAFLNAEAGKNLDQALTFAERAKQRVPDNPNISDTLGYVYYKRDLNTEALRIFRQIVQDQPENSTFRLHLAMALLKQGDKQGARSEAEKALRNASQPQQQSEIKSFVSQIG